jgi:hypothetical protein
MKLYVLYSTILDQTLKSTHLQFPCRKENQMFWEELIAYFPFIRYEPHRKRKIRGEHTDRGDRQTDRQREREQGDLIRLTRSSWKN